MSSLGKKHTLKSVGFELLLLLFSAAVFSQAFPGFVFPDGCGFLAFFALIPVFWVIRRTTWPWIPLYGFFFGFVFYLCFNYWLSGFAPLAVLIVPIIKGAEMIFLFLALKASAVLFKKRSYLAEAVVFVAYYYLSQSWFAGYPYGNIAYALYRYRPLIQIADLTGIWGIDFLLIIPQAYLGEWLETRGRAEVAGVIPKLRSLWASLKEFSGKYVPDLIIYAVLALASLIYGIVSIFSWNAAEPERIWRVVAVQHNHDSWQGGVDTYLRNYNVLTEQTLEALEETKDADIVIWSETAFVPSIVFHTTYRIAPRSLEMVEDLLDFAESLPVPLLIGNPDMHLAHPDDEWKDENLVRYNSTVLFEDGEIKETYYKQHLVPFSEHFPFEDRFPRLYAFLASQGYNWWDEGTEPTVFETSDGVKFSTPICFEDVFGYLSADFVKNGAEVIVNMSNDNWSKAYIAEQQHAAMGAFRSVENRRSTVRGTNSGITCMITPTGRIVEPMEAFAVGWHVYDVPVYTRDQYGLTLYTRTGDTLALIFVWVAFALLGIGIVMAIVRAVRKRRS